MRYLTYLIIFSGISCASYLFCEENLRERTDPSEINLMPVISEALFLPSIEDSVIETAIPAENLHPSFSSEKLKHPDSLLQDEIPLKSTNGLSEEIADAPESDLFSEIFIDLPKIKEETYSLSDIDGVPFDRKLINLLNKDHGIFIEVGAHDGITQSNTFLLEKNYGWSGLLIEPSICLFETLQINRPQAKCFGCALGSFDEDNTYVYGDFHGNLMDSIGGKRLDDLNSDDPSHKSAQTFVLMRSLQSILDEENLHHINLFSLDTEGYEYNILKGIDYSKTIFDYLLIEIYAWDYDRICALLEENGYCLVECFSKYDHRSNDWDGTHNDYLFKRIGI
jgi:FkbM family methyltransferase